MSIDEIPLVSYIDCALNTRKGKRYLKYSPLTFFSDNSKAHSNCGFKADFNKI